MEGRGEVWGTSLVVPQREGGGSPGARVEGRRSTVDGGEVWGTSLVVPQREGGYQKTSLGGPPQWGRARRMVATIEDNGKYLRDEAVRSSGQVWGGPP